MFLKLIVLLVTFANVRCVSDEMKDLMDNLHKTCIANTGVDEARIADANQGRFEDDEKLKCYMRCVFDEVGLFEGDVFDVEGCIAMLPDEVRDTKLSDVVRKCGASSTGACQSMFDFNKCVYEGAPDLYFLP
uniref:Odorant binding protein 3 n=1 Tax=Callosobruchus chinensis TaxID=146774 RepID=A0A7D6LHM8_CALCS|nr:odorant binding protein 3 [Callosobruchus chinensis]